jgi:hypothetical protein
MVGLRKVAAHVLRLSCAVGRDLWIAGCAFVAQLIAGVLE